MYQETVTFDAFASSLWPYLPITLKSRDNYRGAYDRYLSQQLGSQAVNSITKNDLIRALDPLPPQTRYVTLMCARVIFREALYRELVTESPAAKIMTPRISVRPAKFLTWEELRELDFGRHTTRIRFLALHGLRWGEAVALTEADIHDDLVHVTKSVHGETKSKAGVRDVPLISAFDPYPRYQKRVADALSPYGVTVHSLRKTYAYTLKSSGVHVTTAAKLMGHANPSITLKIYTAVRDDETKKAGAMLLEYIK